MKASIPRSLLLATGLVALAMSGARAQDTVMQKDGQRRDGQITGVRTDAIRIKIGPVETAIPLTNVQSVEMAAPANYTAAVESWRTGNVATTLDKLEPLVATFKGLPTPWAERACSLLPEVYIAGGRTANADAALKDFQKFYPVAGSSTDLILARLAIAKGDFSTAREKLVPLADRAKATKLPGGADAPAFSQALLLMGKVHEQAGEKSQALENYLLVTTIFDDDPSSVTQATERARTLHEEKVIVP